MYYINIKEQFDIRFMITALIFSRQGYNMFLARSVLGPPNIFLRVLAMLSFSVITFYSAIVDGPCSLYRKKVISAFKLNQKSLGPGTRFRGKKR